MAEILGVGIGGVWVGVIEWVGSVDMAVDWDAGRSWDTVGFLYFNWREICSHLHSMSDFITPSYPNQAATESSALPSSSDESGLISSTRGVVWPLCSCRIQKPISGGLC